MKNLNHKLTDPNLCIGKLDEADAECRKCSGYDYRRICYFAKGNTKTNIKELTSQEQKELGFLARIKKYFK